VIRYLCKEAPYGGELSFSEDSMRDMHNADLCDTLGNLVHRATSLCQSYCHGMVPDVVPIQSPIQLGAVIDAYTSKMDNFELQGGANVAIQAFRELNGYLQEAAPWKLKGDEYTEARQVIVRATLEAIYALAHLLLPFLPVGSTKIFRKLHTEPTSLKTLNRDCINLQVGTQIEVGEILYAKSLSEEASGLLNEAVVGATKAKESHADAQKRKKEAKLQAMELSKKGMESALGGDDPNQSEFTKIEIRVGKIIKVWNHEKADKLFCEQIDMAEETGPREIASGLREHYSLEDMQDRLVLVVCNLKPAKLFDFVSSGMVLAAKSADGSKVELVEPPADAIIGERVFIEGLTGEPASSTQVKKKKVWEGVAKDLRIGDGGVATWTGQVIQTSAGPCKAPTLVGVPIS
jgi:methionine--tRNA ligase beta chain